ncbi:MAG: hypothetical protein H7829_07340 [Magnetococcus sp. THC-1_WYH]
MAMNFSCDSTCVAGVGCAGVVGVHWGATAGWGLMPTFYRLSMIILLLFLTIPGVGQAGGLSWGTGYYRVRPETPKEVFPSGRSPSSSQSVERRDTPKGDGAAGIDPWSAGVAHDGGMAGDLPERRVTRPWGEVPLEWSEGETDRGPFAQDFGDDGRADLGRGTGGRWGGEWGVPSGGYGPGWGGGWRPWGVPGDPWMGGVGDDRYLFHPGPFGW